MLEPTCCWLRPESNGANIVPQVEHAKYSGGCDAIGWYDSDDGVPPNMGMLYINVFRIRR